MMVWGRPFRCGFLTTGSWELGLVEFGGGGGGLQDLILGTVVGLVMAGWGGDQASRRVHGYTNWKGAGGGRLFLGFCNNMGRGGKLVVLEDGGLLVFVLVTDGYIEVRGGWRLRSLALWPSSSGWLPSYGLRRRCGRGLWVVAVCLVLLGFYF